MATGRTNAVGTAMNFNVAAGTSSPGSPKENTIWVKASSVAAVSFGPSAMPSYSATANSVYIGYAPTSSSTSSGNRLSFIKQKGNISSVPGELLSCYQYQSYTWKKVYAYIYKSGSWVQFSSEFSATITVTYPSGSTVTCSDGSTTLTASSTSGSYTFDVPNTGTWTVKAVSGSNSASEAVSITYSGQSASVTLTYFEGYLFNYGSVNTDITGGWTKSGGGTVITNSDGSVELQPTEGYSQSIYRTTNKIDLSNFTKLTLNGIMWEADGGSNRTRLCVWSAISYGDWEENCVSYKGNSGNVSTANHALDVSSLTGSYYVGVAATDHPNWASLTMNTLRLT